MYIDGIAASQNIDTAGERIIIEGLDISSLVGSVFNYEHLNTTPDHIVGKILKAKKIFSDKDCEDDRELYYWNKCTTPFLYVMGELFDSYKDSAKEVAGMFRYDEDHRGKTPTDTIGFSIEGAKISKENMDITRSIARKVTITVLPANKAAIAEMVPPQADKKDSLDEIFKTETFTEIRIVKDTNKTLLEMLKKEDPFAHAKILGVDPISKALSSGSGISAPPPMLVQGASLPKQNVDKPVSNVARPDKGWGGIKQKDSSPKGFGKIIYKKERLKKAMTAGSGLGAAPGNLVQGAALAPEDLGKKKKKNQWLARAENLYNKWDKKEEFRSFMQKRLPKLAMGEIDAIGNVIALNKAQKQNPFSEFEQGEPLSYVQKTEWSRDRHGNHVFNHPSGHKFKIGGFTTSSLEHTDPKGETTHYKGFQSPEHAKIRAHGLMPKDSSDLGKALTFGTPEDQAKIAADNAERAKNPPKKTPYKKPPAVNAPFESEVSHTAPFGNDKKYETVHLKSGHELGGHPAGKYKTGDKVSVKPHLMGTHLMEHKK